MLAASESGTYTTTITSLRSAGMVTKTELRRGAVEHFYRTASAFLDDRERSKLLETIQKGMSARLVQSIFTEAAEALETGSFDSREERHVSWVPMRVDERGWQESPTPRWTRFSASWRSELVPVRAGEAGGEGLPGLGVGTVLRGSRGIGPPIGPASLAGE